MDEIIGRSQDTIPGLVIYVSVAALSLVTTAIVLYLRSRKKDQE